MKQIVLVTGASSGFGRMIANDGSTEAIVVASLPRLGVETGH